jgi:hypothetical protein
LGLVRNPERAREFYAFAAEHGHAEAQALLAKMREEGVGLAKEPNPATQSSNKGTDPVKEAGMNPLQTARIVEPEITPGRWAITKANLGIAPATLLLELRRDGTVQGRLGGLGPYGALLEQAMPGIIAKVNYGGSWKYDQTSKILEVNLMCEVWPYPIASELWSMKILSSEHGIYRAINEARETFEIKRIG